MPWTPPNVGYYQKLGYVACSICGTNSPNNERPIKGNEQPGSQYPCDRCGSKLQSRPIPGDEYVYYRDDNSAIPFIDATRLPPRS